MKTAAKMKAALKGKTMPFRISDEILERVRKVAQREGRHIHTQIEMFIKGPLEEAESKKP